MSSEEVQKSETLVRLSIATHVVLVATLVSTLVWLVPRFGAVLREIVGGHIPSPFLSAIQMSYFARNNFLFFIPGVAILLWLDFRFSRMLCCRVSGFAAILWSVAVTAAVAGYLFWLFYAMSTFWPKLFHHA